MSDAFKIISAMVLIATGTFGLWAYGHTVHILGSLSLSLKFFTTVWSVILLIGLVQMTVEGVRKERAMKAH